MGIIEKKLIHLIKTNGTTCDYGPGSDRLHCFTCSKELYTLCIVPIYPIKRFEQAKKELLELAPDELFKLLI